MARGIHKLTPDRVWRLSKKPGMHCDGGGLYLCVTPPSACSWVYRFMLRGMRREMGLGAYPDLSLDTARELAREQRTLKAAGKDPLKVRESERASQGLQAAKAITFRECAAAYIAGQSGKWKSDKHEAQWTATLEQHAMPILGDVPVGSVDKQLVIKVLEPIWKVIPETANRVRRRIEAVLDWAAVRDYRSGSNPAAWKGLLDKIFPARSQIRPVVHHPALPFDKVADFVADLGEQEGDASVAFIFTILTAARTSEVLGMEWRELDLEKAVWTVPAERMKGKREHKVPLSRQAVAILQKRLKQTGGKGFVFPGRDPKRPLSNMAMLKVLARMERQDLTVHGFRSSFRDWAEERTAFQGSVTEAALAHVVGDKVEAAYRRGDLFEKRRQLMEAWGKFCTTPAATGSVVSLKGSRRHRAAKGEA